MKRLIIPIGMLLIAHSAYGQLTQGENYIQTKTYLDYNGTTPTKISETVQYFDGLGRPKQIVNVKASPQGKDVVTPIEYDAFGRQTKDYLPIPQSGTQNGAIVPTPLGNASSVYGSEKIYAEKVLENSPLDRIQQQIQVGNDWANKPVKFDYDANVWEDYVRKYETTTTWVDGRTQTSVQLLQYFQPSQLYKNTITDEDGNKTIEFKNGKGQVLLVRKVLNSTQNTDTYYVYNEYDQLAFVVPPQASAPTVETATVENFYYQYRYDGRGRLVEKKLPGKGWEYMIYDKADRLVMTQDANLKSINQWMITEYDALNRVAYTGIIYNSASRNDLQGYVSAYPPNNIKRSTSYFTVSGMNVYYNMSPTVIVNVLLSVNYYDTYPQGYSFNPPFPSTIQGEPVLSETPSDGRSTKGLPVVSMVKNIEDDNWTKNYTYYDTKGRAIGSYSINHLGGYTRTESKLDFVGTPQTVVTGHKRLNTDTEKVITENFTYDHQNRLLVHKHQVDSNPEEILAQNKYNELSQLESKKVGGTVLGSSLQTIDYRYNIRGWMTQINDLSFLGGDLFAYKINYNQVEGLETPNSDFPDLKVKQKYNGNISEVSWKTLTEENEPLKRYGYVYDPLNRLSAGFYQKAGSEAAKEYFERTEYDLNGNITRLQRSADVLSGGTTALAIDNLKYDYSGNRLTKVTEEQVGNNNGYPYLAIPNIIEYDNGNANGNGNMTSHLDKGISAIQYNFLNLPNKFSYSYGNYSYKYRADGVKVEKESYFSIPNLSFRMFYIDGFQYSNYNDYSGSQNFGLKFVPTSEGYYDFTSNSYIYNYVDHLGNVRLSYSDANKDGIVQPRDMTTEQCIDLGGGAICTTVWVPGEITEINNYYPFGLLHNYTNPSMNDYNYKYQGQELQETGFYSFKWRQYMPDVGRFFNIDPLAEKYTYNSTYAFSENRVIDARELEGLEAQIINKSTRNNPVSSDISGYNFSTPAKVQLRTNVVQGSFTNEQVQQKLSTVENNFRKEGLDLTIVQDNKATYTIDMTFPGRSEVVHNNDGTTTRGTVLGDAPEGNPITATVNAKDGNTDTITHEVGHTFGLPHSWEANSGVDSTPDNNNNRMNTYENPTPSMKGFGTEFNTNQIQKMEETIKANSFRLPK